jgi:hypothetical protein
MKVLDLEHMKVLDRLYEALYRIKRGSKEFRDEYEAVIHFAKVEHLYFLTRDIAFSTAIKYFHLLKVKVSKESFSLKLDCKDIIEQYNQGKNMSRFLKVLDTHLDELTYEYTRMKLTDHPNPEKLLRPWTMFFHALGKRAGRISLMFKIGCDSGRRFYPLGCLLQNKKDC